MFVKLQKNAVTGEFVPTSIEELASYGVDKEEVVVDELSCNGPMYPDDGLFEVVLKGQKNVEEAEKSSDL